MQSWSLFSSTTNVTIPEMVEDSEQTTFYVWKRLLLQKGRKPRPVVYRRHTRDLPWTAAAFDGLSIYAIGSLISGYVTITALKLNIDKFTAVLQSNRCCMHTGAPNHQITAVPIEQLFS